jgi:hypothetical protein
MAAGMILGGLVMMWVLARRGLLCEKLMGTFVMLRSALATRSLVPLRAPASDPGAIALPYSVPLVERADRRGHEGAGDHRAGHGVPIYQQWFLVPMCRTKL